MRQVLLSRAEPLRRRPHQLRDGPPDLNPRQSGRSSKRQKRVRGTAALSQMRLKTSARSVFLNCPFDSKYENLYLALIAGAAALGLTPRCVLEIPTTAARLTRLVDLISHLSATTQFMTCLACSYQDRLPDAPDSICHLNLV